MVGVERRGFTLESSILALICAGYVAWVLSLPVFPTQDGPMHLYYAHVMLALFGHGSDVYGNFYRIKHVLPPYSAYYYLLIGLSRIVPLFLADKLVICGYMVSFVYGFRYLARAVGPSAEQAALIATMLLLNWPLGMGFVNFCLGVSLALWTLGVWMRAVGQPGVKRKALFVAMCLCLVLVHPVPLLVVMGFCTIDLAVRFFGKGRVGGAIGSDAICLLLAMTTLGYVKLFTIANASQQMIPNHASFLRQVLENCHMYVKGQGLVFFSQFFHDATWTKRIYRLLLTAMVPVPLLLGLWQAARDRRTGQLRRSWPWLPLTLALIAAQPFFPHDINASHFFADRLLIFVWIGALLVMCPFMRMGAAGRIAFAAAAIVGTAATLWTADPSLRLISNEMARVERGPVAHAGELGIALGDVRMVEAARLGLTFDPYRWGAANYFRHNDAVFYGTPWLDLTVIPLGAREGLATGALSPNAIEDWVLLREALVTDAKEREKVLATARFAVVNHVDRPPMPGPDPLLPRWTCREEQAWFAVCTP